MLIALAVIFSAAPLPHLMGQSSTPKPSSAELDSLSVRLVDLEIEEARCELQSQTLWRRLLPRVTVTASMGISELTFQEDPGALIYPKDAYRVTLSLSLNPLFDPTPGQKAHLRLDRLRTQRELLVRRLREDSERDWHELKRSLERGQDELRVQERLNRYYLLKFEQGHLEYPTLARSELELLILRQKVTTFRELLGSRSKPDHNASSVQTGEPP